MVGGSGGGGNTPESLVCSQPEASEDDPPEGAGTIVWLWVFARSLTQKPHCGQAFAPAINGLAHCGQKRNEARGSCDMLISHRHGPVRPTQPSSLLPYCRRRNIVAVEQPVKQCYR